jgi:CheY-like chemotaxis protein
MERRKQILVVDDDKNNVELILSALAEQEFHYEAAVAHDGAEALDYLSGRGSFAGRNGLPPDVVLLDLKMPRMDGFDFLRELRASEDFKLLPVVVFTSSEDESDRLRSYQLGANAYVVKPVDYEEFLQAIQAIGTFWAVVNEPPPASAWNARLSANFLSRKDTRK